MLAPARDLERLLVHDVGLVGEDLKRYRAVTDDLDDVARERLVVGDARGPHQRRIRGETLDVRVRAVAEDALEVGTVGEDLGGAEIEVPRYAPSRAGTAMVTIVRPSPPPGSPSRRFGGGSAP